MSNYKSIVEEVEREKAVGAIFRRIEKEHGKIKRVAKYARRDKDGTTFYFTLVLETYEILDITLRPNFIFGGFGIEVEIEIF
jgi:hypothetical protein